MPIRTLPHTTERLADQLTLLSHDVTRSILTDNAGREILHIGGACQVCLGRTAPLTDYGQVVGVVTVETDLVPILLNAAKVGFLGFTSGLILMLLLGKYIFSPLEQVRKKNRTAEEKIKHSEARHGQILQTSMDGFWITDTKGRILEVNDVYCQLIGYTREELLCMHIMDVEANENPEETMACIQDIIIKGCERFETRQRRKDGFLLEIEVSVVYRTDSTGGYFSVFLRNITEYKQAEEELRLKAKMLDSVTDAVFLLDFNGSFIYINEAAWKTRGYTHDEMMAIDLHVLDTPKYEKNIGVRRDEILQKGQSLFESEHRCKNGSVMPVEVNCRMVEFGGRKMLLSVARDMTASRTSADEIEHLAFYDQLTNLPNRRLLMDRLKHLLASRTQQARQSALLFIDLDNFKTLNDTLGHDVGDLLLQNVAIRLSTCIREGDTVARLGGDEFVIILENLSCQPVEAAAQTEIVGEKILTSLNQPYQLDTYSYNNSPSIGVTLFSNSQISAEELMKQADIAMYQAKKAGRNTLCFFDPDMQAAINARAELEAELRIALENHQFHLYYQIQVDGSCQPLGAEALIRWMHPQRGLVPPVQFIPLAEETGLILPIGRWVLDTACAQLKIWQNSPRTQNLVLAVNVSAKQFRQPDFADQIQEIVQRHGINPARLKLELTESLLLENIESIIATMNTLNKIGVQFSLDDFGTGYSSLQYLKRLPLNQLKIDQSFVRDIIMNNSDKAIVRTIIAMAKSLNLKVIAEGVETEEQRHLLQNKGCTHFQGYLFSKPIPIESFNVLIKKAS